MVHLVSLLIVDLTFNVSKWSGDQYKPLSNASVPAVTLVSNEKSQVLGSPTLSTAVIDYICGVFYSNSKNW